MKKEFAVNITSSLFIFLEMEGQKEHWNIGYSINTQFYLVMYIMKNISSSKMPFWTQFYNVLMKKKLYSACILRHNSSHNVISVDLSSGAVDRCSVTWSNVQLSQPFQAKPH